MKFSIGMFFNTGKSIAKITSINKEEKIITLRKFSLGSTKEGYHFQQSITINQLYRKIQEGKYKVVHWDDVMSILFFKLIGGKNAKS